MILYLALDADPLGGYYDATEFKPDLRGIRRSIVEVREIEEFPEEIWRFVLAGGLPVDADGSNDSTWVAWWGDGRTIWVAPDRRALEEEVDAS